VPAFRVKLGASDLKCVDVPLNPTHSCKKWLKSVYIYGRYRIVKTGVPLFWNTLYIQTTHYGNIWRNRQSRYRRRSLVIFSTELEVHHMPLEQTELLVGQREGHAACINDDCHKNSQTFAFWVQPSVTKWLIHEQNEGHVKNRECVCER